MNLHKIITTARGGDYTPLYRLLLNYYPRCIHSLLKKLNISKLEADDLFAEAKYKFIERFVNKGIAPPTTIKDAEGYIYNSARNYYFDLKKKKDRQTDELNIATVEQYLEHKEAVNHDQISKDYEAKIKAVLIARKKLDANCLKLVTQRKIEKIPLDEILKKVSLKNKEVLKTRITQCWKKFKKLCDDHYNDLEE